MATNFSVWVNIGGKLDPSLKRAVKEAETEVKSLGQVFAGIGAAIHKPFAAFDTAIEDTKKKLAQLRSFGRQAMLGLSLPGTFAARSVFGDLYDFEYATNQLKAYTDVSEQQHADLKGHARNLGRDTQFTATQAMLMEVALGKAGRSYEQIKGMTGAVLDFALFGKMDDPEEAANVITAITSAYRMQMKTVEEAAAAARKVGDVIAQAANQAVGDVPDFALGFKYAAPFAFRAGVSIEELAAAIGTMTNNGIPGQEAGVAFRSMLVRMVKPTLGARKAMAMLGIQFEDFAKNFKQLNLNDLQTFMSAGGVDIKPVMAALQQSIAGMSLEAGDSYEEIGQKLRDGIIKGLGIKSTKDQKEIAKNVSDFLSASIDEVGVENFLDQLHAKGVTMGQLARIFDVRQGARLSTLLGSGFAEFLAELQAKSPGASERGARDMEEGFPGAVKRFQSALENLKLAIGTSVLEPLTQVLEKTREWMNALAEVDPEKLGLATKFAGLAMAIGPIALALGTIGQVGAFALGGLSKLLWLVIAPLRLIAVMAAGVRTALMFTGVGAALVAIAAAGKAIYDNWQGLVAFFQGFGDAFKKALGPEALGAINGLLEAGGRLLSWITGFDTTINASAGQWRSWGEAAGAAVGHAVNVIVDLPNKIAEGFQRIPSMLSQLGVQAGAAIRNYDWAGLGRYIVEAIVSGIASAAGALIAKMGSIAAQGAAAVKGAVSGAFSTGAANLPATIGSSHQFKGPPGSALPGRASGGPVRAGSPYMVGERGWEVFVPDTNGRIIDHKTSSRMAAIGATRPYPSPMPSAQRSSVTHGGHTFNITVQGGGNPEETAAAVRRELSRLMSQSESDQRGLLSD